MEESQDLFFEVEGAYLGRGLLRVAISREALKKLKAVGEITVSVLDNLKYDRPALEVLARRLKHRGHSERDGTVFIRAADVQS